VLSPGQRVPDTRSTLAPLWMGQAVSAPVSRAIGRLVMSGRFLPHKYYDNELGVPEYGFGEEQ
jgi:hypothetical protein